MHILSENYDMIESASYYEDYKYTQQQLKLLGPNKFPMEKHIIRLENMEKSIPCTPILNAEAFNLSQLEAVDNNLCLIHGPPGTGKSFVAPKIVETLLSIVSEPILILGYKNSILDQILQAI